MAIKIIYTVGLQLPTQDIFEPKSFNSNISLLDADIVLFEPNLVYQTDYINGTYNGKASLSEASTTQCLESIKHWQEELKTSYEHGKTIFIFTRAYEEVYYQTGRKEYSGTGRNMKTTHIVDLIDSYIMIPFNFTNKKIAKGKNIKFTKDATLIKGYWEVVKDICEYELYFETKQAKPLIQTKIGDKTVGAILRNNNGGTILFLPPLNLPDNFYKMNLDGKTKVWTSIAIQFGKQLLSQIIAIDKSLKSESQETPSPTWLNEQQFQLEMEKKYLSEIEILENQLVMIQTKIDLKKSELQKEILSKKLLFENGKPLENAIIEALQVIGFTAENYDDGNSEFDIVFESKEGRFIGEAEGKDNAPIAITKFRQLESNIQEDFAREEVSKYAKGILFGNPYRLIHPQDRKEFFTQKALDAAKRTGIALVNTHELFEVVKYLKQSKNKIYAKKVRECFKNTYGEIIKFPPIKKEANE
ncbi:MAG: hypothetical protein Q8R58_07835 [Sulfuricurvum sp.]|nr:hypothetical protein [Sulfuricurvum sp.]